MRAARRSPQAFTDAVAVLVNPIEDDVAGKLFGVLEKQTAALGGLLSTADFDGDKGHR